MEDDWRRDFRSGAVFGTIGAFIAYDRGWVGWPLWLEVIRDGVGCAVLAVPISRLLRLLPDRPPE